MLHKDTEACQMITVANSMRRVGKVNKASCSRPAYIPGKEMENAILDFVHQWLAG